MKWFKHMTGTWDDEKIADLLAQGRGEEGRLALYGLWWRMLEIVASQMDKTSQKASVTYSANRWAQLLGMRACNVRRCLSPLEKSGLVTFVWNTREKASEQHAGNERTTSEQHAGNERPASDIQATIANLLKYRDEYSRKSGHAPDNVAPEGEGDTESTSRAERQREGEMVSDDPQSAPPVLNGSLPVLALEPDPPKPTRPKKRREGELTKTAIAKTRHAEFKEAIFAYWKSKNGEVDCPWGQSEGTQLEMWLRASPNTTLAQFKAMLRNRYRSEVVHSDRPSGWIRNITSYAHGPIDRFGKPMNSAINPMEKIIFANARPT